MARLSINVEVRNPVSAEPEVWELLGTGSDGQVEFLALRRGDIWMDYDEFMSIYMVDGSEIDAWHERLVERYLG